MNIQALLAKARGLLDAAHNLLKGEAARFIGYGAALVVVGVVTIANAIGVITISLTLSDALVLTTSAITFLVGVIESIRRLVFSQNTVDAIVEELAPGEGLEAHPPAGEPLV